MDKTKAAPPVGSRPVQRTDLTVHELDGEALVYDAATANTHRLNETALFIWRQCRGRQDVQHIAERLTEIYDVSLESAIEHVERMFRAFKEQELVLTDVGV